MQLQTGDALVQRDHSYIIESIRRHTRYTIGVIAALHSSLLGGFAASRLVISYAPCMYRAGLHTKLLISLEYRF